LRDLCHSTPADRTPKHCGQFKGFGGNDAIALPADGPYLHWIAQSPLTDRPHPPSDHAHDPA
jgi:hypothetical protein